MYKSVFANLPEKIKPYLQQGKVADYIPALKNIPREKFGIAAIDVDEVRYQAGDAEEQFSIQSISKVFALTLAFRSAGDDIWNHVGRNLSAKAFNSIMQIEEANGLPQNPFTNAGAIVIVDLLLKQDPNYLDFLLSFVRQLSLNPYIDYDQVVSASEKKTGHRNAAIAHFLKSYGMLHNPVDRVLEAYFTQCSLAMSCKDLSRALLFLANQGFNPGTGDRVLTSLQNRHLNALLLMFGTYEAAGDVVFRIGLPGKSGVGGGIAVIVPKKMAIVVWSPALDRYGTSVAGLKALELLTDATDLKML